MKSPKGIIEVDPIFVNHEHLIKSTGICGLSKSYHDPYSGLNIVLSRDNPFRKQSHEGAHSYITQTGYLGFLMMLLTNTIYILFLKLLKKRTSPEKRKKILLTMKRLSKIRRKLTENFRVLHEIFAICTEEREIIKRYRQKYGDNEKKFREECIKELYGLQFSEGRKEHIIALDFSNLLYKIYEEFMYIDLIAHVLLRFFPIILTEIEPSILLYRDCDKRITNLLNIKDTLLDSLINDVPRWAPDPSLRHIYDFGHEITKRLESMCKLKPFSKYISLLNEDCGRKFWAILPLDDNEKHNLVSICRYDNLYNLILTDKKKDQLIKLGKSRDRNIKVSQSKSGSKENDWDRFFSDPLRISPPIALIREGNHLILAVRADVNNPEGLSHMYFRNAQIGIIDMMLEDDLDRIILCFQSYAPLYSDDCSRRPENCLTTKLFYTVGKVCKPVLKLESTPTLICCKDNIARVFRLSTSGQDIIPSECYPFKIVEKRPLI